MRARAVVADGIGFVRAVRWEQSWMAATRAAMTRTGRIQGTGGHDTGKQAAMTRAQERAVPCRDKLDK